MIVYFLFFLIVACIAACADLLKGRLWRNLALFFIFVILFVPASIRYGIGTDYFFTYMPAIDAVLSGGDPDIDYSYVCIVNFVDWLGLDMQCVFVVYALITYSAALLALRNQPSLFIGVSIYFLIFYCSSLGLMRQCAAAAVLMLSVDMAFRKHWPLFIILLCLAGFLHKSAMAYPLLMGAAFVISRLKKPWLYVVLGFAFFGACLLNGADLIMNLAVNISDHFLVYFMDEENSGAAVLNSGLGTILRGILLMMMFGFLVRDETPSSRWAAIMAFFFVCALIVGMKLEIFRRFDVVLSVIVPIGCGMLYKSENLSARCSAHLAVFAYLLLFLNNMRLNVNNVIPYTTIFHD